MRLDSLLVAAGYVSTIIAHGGGALPKIVGGRRLPRGAEVGRRTYAALTAARKPADPEPAELDDGRLLGPRQNTDGRCGVGFGASCASGYCCSAAGWCGTGPDYCAAPDCQLNFGTGCDGNQVPSGASTASVARPHLGAIPYGGLGIYDCVVPGDIAVTFDDGPYVYTADLLDKLRGYNARATFFITGNNLGKGQINDPSTPWPAVIRRMMADGHQVASHTWSHQNASELSQQQMRNQMLYNEIAFNDILGFFPTYMRPPFSICESQCQSVMSTLGYHVVYFDLDTEGYLNDDPALIQTSKNIWDAAINAASPASDSFLHIEHDIHAQTVYNLTDYLLTSLLAHGFRAVTLGECLADPSQNWYRAGSGTVPTYTQSPPTPTQTGTLRVSTDGSCGAGVTCQGSTFGNCCSQHSFCGSTTAYCGAGCNVLFGTCADSPLPSTSSAPSPTPTLRISVDGSCGSGVTCQGSTFGNCCSSHSFCGSTAAYCGAGCNPLFGSCSASASSSSSAPAPSSTLRVSVDGSCGGGVTCQGSTFGNCCSSHSFCGSTSAYCGAGCQPPFGSCSSGSSSSAPPPPTSTLRVSVDGSCGSGVTCQGATYGNCCSQYFFCGSASTYCGQGCRPQFGTCS